jgi:uncharacterized protein YjaZ
VIQVGTRNVQAIVTTEVHHVLREVAYEKQVTLKDLICAILNDFVDKVNKEAQLKRTLSVP